MEGCKRNPYSTLSLPWMAWKEQHERNDMNTGPYIPYHVGTTPDGADCKEMPRVVSIGKGMFKCPSCLKEFPSATKLIKNGEDIFPTV